MVNSEGYNPTDFGSVEDYYSEDSALDNGQCPHCGGSLMCVDSNEDGAIIVCSVCKTEV